jgi:hypothetical protein
MLAKSSCSGCGREQYCVTACQKLDWKKHRSMCLILKKLSNMLQPFLEVHQIINEVLASKKGDDIRILEHLLPYAEYRFGKPITGKDYRERTDGQRMIVDIGILLRISNQMSNVYAKNSSVSALIRYKEMLPHLVRSLNILSPWTVTIDSDSNSLNSELTDYLLKVSTQAEENMTLAAINRNRFDVAEKHCHQCLTYSRKLRVEREEKTTSIFDALDTYASLCQRQGDNLGAVAFAEDAYNLVVDVYNPVHPQVQVAAGWLIYCLILYGDLSNAERFAEQTYANLRDIKNGMDQESEQVARGANNLLMSFFNKKTET